ARGVVRVILVVGPRREGRHVVQVGGREQHVVVERDVIGGSQRACEGGVSHRVRIAPCRVAKVRLREVEDRRAPGRRCGGRGGWIGALRVRDRNQSDQQQ